MKLQLPELLSPIHDEELPHLEAYKKKSGRMLATMLIAVNVSVSYIEVIRGPGYFWRTTIAVSIGTLLAATAILAGRRAATRGDLAVVPAVAALLWDIATIGWINERPQNDALTVLPTVPLLVACFIPWKPTYSVILGMASGACVLVSANLGVRPPGAVYQFVLSIGINMLMGAMATQLQRRLWHRLEKARAQLAASDRMTVLGRMSAGIAHEMKTPLAAAMNGLESVRTLAAELGESIGHPDVEPADLHEIAKEIGEAVTGAASATKRAANFITAIRSHTLSITDVEHQPYAVASAVSSAVMLVEHAGRASNVVVDTSAVANDIIAEGDEGKLAQIVTNLVCNALDACAGGRGTRVRVSARAESADGERLVLVVEDDGPGVPEAHRERIFDALFTTKRDAEGTGLGLAISRDVAEGALGGTLCLAPSERGARFELKFPRKPTRRISGTAWTPAKVA